MDRKEFINNWIIRGPEFVLQNVSVDNVIFGYHEKELKVLLQKPHGLNKWLLPGGYIRKNETIVEAATRVATDRTGLDKLFLKQFKAFGTPGRSNDPEFTPEIFSKLTGLEIPEGHWMFDYFVSVGFYTLTEFSMVTPNGEYYMEECAWLDINNLPTLMFDHKEMIIEALDSLRIDLYHHPIGLQLLPEKFTLPEIHSLYETILNRQIDSRNFSKKLMSTGLIVKLKEKRNIGAHRSPYLYKFDVKAYQKALELGMVLVL